MDDLDFDDAAPDQAEGRNPVFGTAALAFAALTFVVPAGIAFVVLAGFGGALAAPDPNPNPNAGQAVGNVFGGLFAVFFGLFVAFAAAGVMALGGTLAGVVALARGERSQWRSVVGLFVCGGVTALMLLWFVAAQLN